MRRIVALAFALTLTGSLLPGPAAASGPDNTGPACTDIKGRGGTSYEVLPRTTAPIGNAQFHFEFFLADAPCSFATYILHVTDSNGGSRTATYPAGLGDDALTLCGTNKLCYDHSFGSTPGGAPTTLFVTGESMLGNHTADITPTVDYVLCDANISDSTYPDCPIGDNSWDG